MDDITKIDLYELLGILSSASIQEVKKAYRKKALKCHPDKNPDNPKAAELFHQLSRALEILIDDAARCAYDKVINAKKAAALRNRELDTRRKKLKEDLEARERQAQFDLCSEKSAEYKYKVEIERLQKEGSKQLEEEIELVRLQVQREQFNGLKEENPSCFRLKINWKISNNANSGDVYNDENLQKIFSKYGEIAVLVVSKKKKGSALLEFCSSSAAVKAQQLEKGFLSTPLTISWLSGSAPNTMKTHSYPVRDKHPTTPASGSSIFPSVPLVSTEKQSFPCFSPAADMFTKTRQEKQDSDFENIVFSRMRQAEDEKRKETENQTKKES